MSLYRLSPASPENIRQTRRSNPNENDFDLSCLKSIPIEVTEMNFIQLNDEFDKLLKTMNLESNK